MTAFAIRVSSVDDLFDPFSAEPLVERPLRDQVRERILNAWIDTREERPGHLTVDLPESERREDLGDRVEAAIRHDLTAAYESSRRPFIFTRSERREALVAFSFLVVLGWVAMWQPAQQIFKAVSLWLSRNRYEELALVPIEVNWV